MPTNPIPQTEESGGEFKVYMSSYSKPKHTGLLTADALRAAHMLHV